MKVTIPMSTLMLFFLMMNCTSDESMDVGSCDFNASQVSVDRISSIMDCEIPTEDVCLYVVTYKGKTISDVYFSWSNNMVSRQECGVFIISCDQLPVDLRIRENSSNCFVDLEFN